MVVATTIAVGLICLHDDALGQMPPEGQSKVRPQSGQVTASPAFCLAQHRVGRIQLAVSNNGTIGREYYPGPKVDCFTGEEIKHSCEYPKNSDISYLFGGAFWIGAVVGRDTLVSVGADGWQWAYEMYPDQAPFGEMIHRSTKDPNSPLYEGAVSEEDYIAVYTDTLTEGVPNDFFGRPHVPLNIEVTQASYAWSYEYAEDFVLFDFRIKNIGERTLRDVFMAVYIDDMCCFDCLGEMAGFRDDHSGFLHIYPDSCANCEFEDTVFIAWAMDDNGDYTLVYPDGQVHPTPAVTGTRIVRTPQQNLDVSFNWWVGNSISSLDFGPREKPFVGRLREDYRDFGTGGTGTPEGDANKYYVMRNREFDYDEVMTGVISPTDTLWTYPDQRLADTFAVGYDTRYLLSFGPFEILPGQTLPISFAYVAGDSVHRIVDNNVNLPDNPGLYLANLDFSDLALNARWAAWVYDNPNYDTDGDGYFGEFVTCALDSEVALVDTVIGGVDTTITVVTYTAVDTCWIKGDGVPDFRGAQAPPAPSIRVESDVGRLVVRFNGLRSETTRDVFSGRIDFEGYRVYLARDQREESFSLVAAFDREDYNKYVYNANMRPWAGFECREAPFTIEELRCLYGSGEDRCHDETFDPLAYSRVDPYVLAGHPESLFYFEPHGYNASQLDEEAPIRKTYSDQPYPSSLDPRQADSSELTEDGHLKYFEYEATIDHLLPSVKYWVSVTAFDCGTPEKGLSSLESSVINAAVPAYALPDPDAVAAQGLGVYVYPNPYRLDADYRGRGFEGREDAARMPDRTRAVHFANLPEDCTIRVYTLDGDLVRAIDHHGGAHDEWDLITRNRQIVVSGLYYWTVDSPGQQTQIGKLVVLR